VTNSEYLWKTDRLNIYFEYQNEIELKRILFREINTLPK